MVMTPAQLGLKFAMKLIFLFCKGAEYVAGLLGILALLLVCYEVVARYFAPELLTDWGAEVIVYLMVWGVFLSFGELARRNEHVSADLIVSKFNGAKKTAYQVSVWVVGLIFSIILAWAGWQIVEFALMLGETGDTSLQFPKAYYYMALPFGMILQCLIYSSFLLKFIRSKSLPQG